VSERPPHHHDRIEAALADPEICRIRRIPDTIRPSPTVGQSNQTAVIDDIRSMRLGEEEQVNKTE
jgi:hypothetical protein